MRSTERPSSICIVFIIIMCNVRLKSLRELCYSK